MIFHIFHIFSFLYLSKILYSWGSILVCITNFFYCSNQIIHTDVVVFCIQDEYIKDIDLYKDIYIDIFYTQYGIGIIVLAYIDVFKHSLIILISKHI